MDMLNPDMIQKGLGILAVIGAIAVGVPALLRALLLFLQVIPGNQGEAAVEKLLAVSEKIADVVSKLFPKPKA